MRMAVALLLTLLQTGLSAPASAAPVLWQGVATILTATRACESDSSERGTIGVGTVLRSLYRPKGIADNGGDSRLSFNHDAQSNFAIFLPNGAIPSGTYAAFGVKHNGVLVANEAGDYRRFRQTPRQPDAATIFIEYTGTIENFMFIEGCTVSFRAAYAPRP